MVNVAVWLTLFPHPSVAMNDTVTRRVSSHVTQGMASKSLLQVTVLHASSAVAPANESAQSNMVASASIGSEQPMVMSMGGSMMTGGVVSTTSICWVSEVEFPEGSVAVNVRM